MIFYLFFAIFQYLEQSVPSIRGYCNHCSALIIQYLKQNCSPKTKYLCDLFQTFCNSTAILTELQYFSMKNEENNLCKAPYPFSVIKLFLADL